MAWPRGAPAHGMSNGTVHSRSCSRARPRPPHPPTRLPPVPPRSLTDGHVEYAEQYDVRLGHVAVPPPHEVGQAQHVGHLALLGGAGGAQRADAGSRAGGRRAGEPAGHEAARPGKAAAQDGLGSCWAAARGPAELPASGQSPPYPAACRPLSSTSLPPLLPPPPAPVPTTPAPRAASPG